MQINHHYIKMEIKKKEHFLLTFQSPAYCPTNSSRKRIDILWKRNLSAVSFLPLRILAYQPLLQMRAFPEKLLLLLLKK